MASTGPTDSARALYSERTIGVRSSFGGDEASALAYYAALVQFIEPLCPAETSHGRTTLLDVGCGVGWSTFAFAKAGYSATGIDLNARAFEPPSHPRCTLLDGSATAIPFPTDTFDVVVCYQCLEHVPEPATALAEMVRVCRPGGVVAIVGPNLVSPTAGIMYLLRPSSWGRVPIRRTRGAGRFPYGATVQGVVGTGVLRGVQLLGKLLRRTPQFLMREPDLVPPFHADNDACYLCNPTDIIRYFKWEGLQIVRRGKPGRLPLSYLFAGGTWVAGRKSDQP